jgi:tRNA nucleotidyltransferase (CCA-adding enzyme)
LPLDTGYKRDILILIQGEIIMTKINIWMVGGAVRDEIMGVKPNDVDFSVEADSFESMVEYVESIGRIVENRPQFGTVKAVVNHAAYDYVWARIEGPYSDSRHPDWTRAGSIHDDLARRDFTMNAIAQGEDGEYYDPFGGIRDISNRTIRCVGSVSDRMAEDPIRLLRAARFSVTKGFVIDGSIEWMFDDPDMTSRVVATVSEDRIRVEVRKMFEFDTVASIAFFGAHPVFSEAIFGSGIWLRATTESR